MIQDRRRSKGWDLLAQMMKKHGVVEWNCYISQTHHATSFHCECHHSRSVFIPLLDHKLPFQCHQWQWVIQILIDWTPIPTSLLFNWIIILSFKWLAINSNSTLKMNKCRPGNQTLHFTTMENCSVAESNRDATQAHCIVPHSEYHYPWGLQLPHWLAINYLCDMTSDNESSPSECLGNVHSNTLPIWMNHISVLWMAFHVNCKFQTLNKELQTQESNPVPHHDRKCCASEINHFTT